MYVEKVLSHAAPLFFYSIHKLVILCVGLDRIEVFITLIHVYTCPMKGELWSVCWLHFDRYRSILYAILKLEDALISYLWPSTNKV